MEALGTCSIQLACPIRGNLPDETKHDVQSFFISLSQVEKNSRGSHEIVKCDGLAADDKILTFHRPVP